MKKDRNTNEYLKTPFLDGIELLNAQNCTVNFPMHKHETYNISLITKNTFHTDLTDKSFIAPPGTIAITNPDELHATPCDSLIGNSFITFYIPPTIITHLGHRNDANFEDKVIYDKSIFNTLWQLSQMKNIFQEHFEQKLTYSLSILLNQFKLSSSSNKANSNLKDIIKDMTSNEASFSLTRLASKHGINQ